MVEIRVHTEHTTKDFEIDPQHFKTLRRRIWLMQELNKVIWRMLFSED